jgi:hypothetical protein
MDATREKPIFQVILRGRDEWAVEVEWPDGILARISTYKDHSSAANWVASLEAWLHFSRVQKITNELRRRRSLSAPTLHCS